MIEITFEPKPSVDPPPCGQYIPWWDGKRFVTAKRLHTNKYQVWTEIEFKDWK
jgi:hypothetical protein